MPINHFLVGPARFWDRGAEGYDAAEEVRSFASCRAGNETTRQIIDEVLDRVVVPGIATLISGGLQRYGSARRGLLSEVGWDRSPLPLTYDTSGCTAGEYTRLLCLRDRAGIVSTAGWIAC